MLKITTHTSSREVAHMQNNKQKRFQNNRAEQYVCVSNRITLGQLALGYISQVYQDVTLILENRIV